MRSVDILCIEHPTCLLFVSRSSDYGSTYTKLNDKVGSRTVLSYLYVCPTNKQKVSISLLLLSLCLISCKLTIKLHFFSIAAKWLYLCLYPSSNAISLVWPAVLKIMMLSDPEVESAVLISSDEGASFEKHPINFKILSLLFHPAQENWILAYSDDSKVTSESMNFWVEIR